MTYVCWWGHAHDQPLACSVVHDYCYTDTLLRCLVVLPAVLQEIVTRLQAADIGVMQYHAEAAPGQFEVVLAPCECFVWCWEGDCGWWLDCMRATTSRLLALG